MLTEKEEVYRIKKSLKAGRTREQVTKALISKGYKYDYISLLLKKSGKDKKILANSVLIILIMGLLAWAVYGNLFAEKNIDLNLVNPLVLNESNSSEISEISKIQITPEFMTYLLGIINAQNYLHNIPLTNNVPIINFRTEEDNFYSIIDKNIQTFEGESNSADIEFYIPKEVIIMTTASESPKEYFLEKVNSGEVSIETFASETELFSKGYLNFYNSLTV
jgi:hypothetical protein